MAWVFLSFTIIFDVAGTAVSKLVATHNHTGLYILRIVCLVMTHVFLIMALKTLAPGLSYAIWSGIGIVLMVIVGTLFFNEGFSMLKFFAIILIVIGVVILSIAPNHS